MIGISTAVIFIALSISIPTMLALLGGLQFTPKDPNCPEDVKDVKTNIKAVKGVLIFDTLALLAVLILLQFAI